MTLAERSGVSQSTISRLERGKAPQAAMFKVVRLSEAIEPRLPLAFCPHDHACGWRRRDENRAPLEKAARHRARRVVNDGRLSMAAQELSRDAHLAD